MATTNSHNMHQVKLSIEARVKSMVNNDLKEVCRGEGLPVSGVKAALQKRILERLDNHAARQNLRAVEALRYRVNNRGQSPPPESMASSVARDATTPISPASNNTNNKMAPHGARPPSLSHYSTAARATMPSTSRVNFRPSPFYQVRESLTPLQDLIEMPQNRHSVNIALTLSDATCTSLRNDDSLSVMLYCAAANKLGPYAMNVDIAFPGQLEVRINGDEVRKSFKGLKNKPGTTKPVDVTDLVRKAPGYTNTIHVTYALTKDRYSFLVNLVKKTSAEELAKQLKQSGNRIPKDVVIQDMVRKAQDPDIIATSSVMSLKDPVSTMRITLPCRSSNCTHTQCFDGSYFLQLQEQAPTWTCPVCNKTLTYASLCVDNYVNDILQATSSSTEQVVIEPNGEWKHITQGEENTHKPSKPQVRASYDQDSDDDIIEIQDTPKKEDNNDKIKAETTSVPPVIALAQQTPPVSRETSTLAPRPNPAKRSSEVIDLTFSDDEDEPPRPAKRTNTSQNTSSSSYNTPASLQDGRTAADLANRPLMYMGSGFQLNIDNNHDQNRDTTVNNTTTLPPIQLPRPNGGVPQGQRLPWPTGAPIWSSSTNGFRGSESYSNSPA